MPKNPSGEFYRGMIFEPDGSGERLILERRPYAHTKRRTIREADRRNWDWRIERCLVIGDPRDSELRVIETWSSVGGHELAEGK